MKLELLYTLCCCLALAACGNRNATGEKDDDNSEARKWFEEGTWRQGWKVNADESLDVAEFSSRYSANPDRWNKAFQFLATTDVAKKEPGRYELDGTNLFVIVQEYPAKEEDSTRFESHKVYADIQYVVDGREQIGVAPLASTEVVTPYDESKDIAFYHAKENNYRLANSERFFIFFPDDAHRPGFKVADGEQVKKVVVKVKL
jgi:YhcH/YjgK/YiaL family protein